MTGKSIVFVNNVGAQTDIVYDGSSGIINSRGEAVTLLKSFSEDFRIIELDADHEPVRLPEQNKTVNVYHAIKLGLQDYFAKNGFKTACLGLSGGIDSAVVVSLAAEALGPENVRVLLMPSQFSSDHSVEDARALGRKPRYRIPGRPDQRNVRGAYYDARPRFRGTSVRCDRGKHAIAHPGHDDDGDIQ